MKYPISVMLSAAVVLGSMPATVYAQQPAGEQEGEQMSAKERARKVEQLATDGAKAYRAGSYQEAIDLFEKAYALEPVPNLLYNIAKCYEKQEKFEEAVQYYQKFVVAPEVDSKARQAALDRMESLRQIADIKKDEGAQGDQGGHIVGRGEQPAEPQVDEPVDTTALWTIGGGVALLGGGLAMGLLASSEADTVKNGATFAERQSAQDSGKTYALVADGLYVAGAAVTAVGLYLYFSDDEADTEQAGAQAVVTPWVSTGSAGVGMSLDF